MGGGAGAATAAVESGELIGVAAPLKVRMLEETVGVLRDIFFAHVESLRIQQPQPHHRLCNMPYTHYTTHLQSLSVYTHGKRVITAVPTLGNSSTICITKHAWHVRCSTLQIFLGFFSCSRCVLPVFMVSDGMGSLRFAGDVRGNSSGDCKHQQTPADTHNCIQ